MSFLTVLYALMFYAAFVLFAGGIIYKIRQYAKTPAPLKIPTMPAPTTQGGVVMRMIREVVLFESLFKGNKWTWLFGWMFHLSLALIVIRHLRYFLQPIPEIIVLAQPFGKYAGFTMVIGLLGLWGRRIFVERIRYITNPSDHLILALLVSIGLSGLSMTFLNHPDIISLKEFVLGLLYFNIQPLPAEPLLLLHLGLVITLMVIFPISKLLHAPGVFFSPTRNQVDNARDKRHLAPWAAKLDQ